MRLYVARLWFEGNRFSPTTTGFTQFRQREWLRGDAALAAARGTATELAAVAALVDAGVDARVDPRLDPRLDARVGATRPAGDSHPHFKQVFVGRCASASPGGPIEDAVFEAFVDETLADLCELQPQAIYLSLHGASITESLEAPELVLLERIRALMPKVPIVASFDLHANLDARLTGLLDFATVYRTYPHVDMRETAERALERLGEILHHSSPRWHGRIAKLGSLVPSFNMRSSVEPMASLQALARESETDPAVVDASILGGFPYADTPNADGAVMVWARTPEAAVNHATALLRSYGARLDGFKPTLIGARDALLQADSWLGRAIPENDASGCTAIDERPIAITDPADNPLSGGAADTPALLRELLRARTDPLANTPAIAALPDAAIVFAYFADRLAVDACHAAGIGARLRLTLGARTGPDFGQGIDVDARVVSLGDGRFINTGPMEHGARCEAGPCSVIDVAGIHIVLASSVCAANDPGFFIANGIDPCSAKLLCVKAKNHFRGAFETICASIIDTDCPGPASADLGALPFRHWLATGQRSGNPG